MVQQVNEFTVEQMLPHQHHYTHEKCRDESECEPKHAHASWDRTVGDSPGAEQRQGKHGNHAAAGNPHSVERRKLAALGGWFLHLGSQANPGEPGHRGDQGNVVKAATVVQLPADRPIRDGGTSGVTEAHAKQTGVEFFPMTLAGDPAGK